jgi:hypothetical protein
VKNTFDGIVNEVKQFLKKRYNKYISLTIDDNRVTIDTWPLAKYIQMAEEELKYRQWLETQPKKYCEYCGRLMPIPQFVNEKKCIECHNRDAHSKWVMEEFNKVDD